MEHRITSKEFYSLEFIGKGTEGIIKRKQNLALKRFYQDNFKSRVEVQFNIKNDNIIFPIEKLYIDDEYLGYVSDFIEGTNDVSKLKHLNNLIPKIIKLENSVKELSEYKILISDLLVKNSLFSNDGIYLIDTSKYYYLPNNTKKEIEYKNIKELNSFLTLLLFYSHENIKGINLKSMMSLVGLKDLYDGLNNQSYSFSLLLTELFKTLNTSSLEQAHNKIKILRR